MSAHARNLSGTVAERRHVEVVPDAVRGDHKVTHVQAVVERAGHARVDDVAHAKAVHEHLDADAGVDLADAALHDDDRRAAKRALAELHAGNARDLRPR